MEQSGSRFPASPLFSFPDISLSLFLSFPEMGFPQHIHGPFIPNPPEPPPPPPPIPSSQEILQLCSFTPAGPGWGHSNGAVLKALGRREGLRCSGSPTCDG